MKKFLIAAALLALGLVACSKQEEAPAVEASAPVAEVASEVASAPVAEVASDVASDVAVASEASAAQ